MSADWTTVICRVSIARVIVDRVTKGCGTIPGSVAFVVCIDSLFTPGPELAAVNASTAVYGECK